MDSPVARLGGEQVVSQGSGRDGQHLHGHLPPANVTPASLGLPCLYQLSQATGAVGQIDARVSEKRRSLAADGDDERDSLVHGFTPFLCWGRGPVS